MQCERERKKEMKEKMASVSVSSLLCEEDDACLTEKFEFDEQEEEEGFVSEIEDEYVEILVQKDINFGLNTFKSSDIDSSKTTTTTTTQIWWKRARLDSINWILNMRVIFGFHFRTAYLSITYFDQFLSKRSIDNGQFWAIRLLSVACLSLAAKMEECKVPLLSDYPIKEFVFENHVIQKMELLVLSTLEWKMVHITPFVFLHYFINKFFFEDVPNPKNVLVSKAVELVSNVTKEINLIDHPPSVIAAAAVLAAYDAQLSRKSVEVKLSLISLWGSLEKEHAFSCYNIMQEIEMRKCYTPKLVMMSPNYSSMDSSSIGAVETTTSIIYSVGSKRRLKFDESDQDRPPLTKICPQ